MIRSGIESNFWSPRDPDVATRLSRFMLIPAGCNRPCADEKRRRERTPDPTLVMFALETRRLPRITSGAALLNRLRQCQPSLDLQVLRGFLASVAHDLVFDLLTLAEGAQSGSLDCGNVYKHVLAATATRRLNEAIAFRRVEPLHSACRHVTSPGYDPTTLAQRTVKMKWVATQKLPGQGLRAKPRP
jgi:hypothetical protein